jgi:hypothetical protein
MIMSARWVRMRVNPGLGQSLLWIQVWCLRSDELAESGELAVSMGEAFNKATPPPGRIPSLNRVFQSLVIEYECIILGDGDRPGGTGQVRGVALELDIELFS